MHTQKLTLSIGVPAYNEQANIKNLLESIFKQKQDNFILTEIIVLSDGSNDKTVENAKLVCDHRIRIIDHKNRKGKAVRFMELLQIIKTDMFVQIDADTYLDGQDFLVNLANAVIVGGDLVFPQVVPLPSKTYVEKLSNFGFSTWQLVLERMDMSDSLIHRCQGRCRAFSKKFYDNFILPPEASIVEDLFSFCYALDKGLQVQYVPDSKISFRLPATLADFIKQNRRFVKGSEVLSKFYDPSILKKFTPSSRLKLGALVQNFFRNPPHVSLGYPFLQFFVRRTASSKDLQPQYEYVSSTKELN